MLMWPASRFVAGESVGRAISAVRELNEDGIQGSLDLLGENVTDRETAERSRSAYVKILHRIAEERIDCNISIKMTMLGLDIEPSLARDQLVAILEAARETENWVRIDMEGSPYTQLTLELFYDVYEAFDNVGVVIQSMLRRSSDDIDRLIHLGAGVRLCKGAYKEPAPLAFQDKREVNDSFDRLAERLLEAGHAPAIATHDDKRIQRVLSFARDHSIDPNQFEFQMLFGVRPMTQRMMVENGYRMRVYVPFGRHWFPYFRRRLQERKENIAFLLRNVWRR